MNQDQSSEDFQPQQAQEVYRLTNDWDKLLDLLPKLHTSATVYRGNHSVHCLEGRCSYTSVANDKAFFNEGFRGSTSDITQWHEAWFYHEKRQDSMQPCIEVANRLGQGLFKLCYDDISDSQIDLPLIQELIEETGDAWSLLHLRRSNLLDCITCAKLKKRPPYINVIRAIQNECRTLGHKLGLISTDSNQSIWNNLPPMNENPSSCWLGFRSGGDSIYIEPAGFHHAEVINNGSRSFALFYKKNGEQALSIIEPEGVRLKSLRTFEKHLTQK